MTYLYKSAHCCLIKVFVIVKEIYSLISKGVFLVREVLIGSGVALSSAGIFMLLYGHIPQGFIGLVTVIFGVVVAMITKKNKVD
ncbi:hypothetical protein [Exiguobacterium sp.]|uniref:hypothetical protein n=1 Tax=Exiguobacterium sp. TaxID=44751 RepID=UPI0025C26CE0|nr:hypothetical protein [Exiguobacterium sp.]